MTELRGARVLITGAASGLGRKLALSLARKGASDLALLDIDEVNLRRVAREVEAVGARARAFRCDLLDREAIYATADKVRAEVGEIDILVNNAGIVSGKSFLELDDDAIERTFGVNTLALFWMTKAFLPQMIRRNRGHVVNVASSAGLIGIARLADYCASKWAAVGFDESLRMELRQRASGVKTTVVMPFFIDTGMFDGAKSRFPLLFPILKEDKVVARIVRAIERDQPRLIMPPLVHIVPIGRVLPPWLFDSIADFFGMNRSMEEFTGRSHGGPAADTSKRSAGANS